MKSTGIIRTVDSVGRMVLPAEIREKFGIKEGGELEIFVDSNSIVLKKYEPTCIFCGGAKEITVFKDRNVCKKCLDKLKTIQLLNTY